MQKIILCTLVALSLCILTGCSVKGGTYVPVSEMFYDASYLKSLRDKRTEEPLNEVILQDKAAAIKLYGSAEAAKKFEGYFPDDPNGGRELDNWWKSPLKNLRSDKEIIRTVRHGLRRTKQDKRWIVRWFCQHFGRPKSFSSRYSLEAFDLMYYASFSPDKNIRHGAVYFGISGGKRRYPKIRRRYVQLSMDFFENVEDTVKIARGNENLQNEMLTYLEPYLNNTDTRIRERAFLLENFFTGKLDYYPMAKTKKIIGINNGTD